MLKPSIHDVHSIELHVHEEIFDSERLQMLYFVIYKWKIRWFVLEVYQNIDTTIYRDISSWGTLSIHWHQILIFNNIQVAVSVRDKKSHCAVYTLFYLAVIHVKLIDSVL